MSGYGEYLKTYRLLCKLSQEELAEQTGLPLTAISKIEGGTRKVELGEAVRLAEVLHITLAQLAGLDPSAREVTQQAVSHCVKKQHQLLQELVSNSQQLTSLVAS
jgi:transcriptional regulator with XRE-family HTH domain